MRMTPLTQISSTALSPITPVSMTSSSGGVLIDRKNCYTTSLSSLASPSLHHTNPGSLTSTYYDHIKYAN